MLCNLCHLAPRAFLPLFELVRPLLSAPTRNAAHLLDYSADNWKQFLRADILGDQLPIQYAGSRQVQPKTLSYMRVHDKFVKPAFDEAAAAAQ